MTNMQIRPVRHPRDLAALDALFAVCRDADGHWPLGEHKYLGLVQGDSISSQGLVAEVEGRIVGYAHLSPNQDDDGWSLEMAVHPLSRTGNVTENLLLASLELIEAAGGRSVTFWVFRPSMAGLLQNFGFRQDRELRQLRCDLPIRHSFPLPAGTTLAPFRPGVDDEAWLEVNNRAFSGHPENGGWTQDVLSDRVAQSWFDARGFLMAWDADGLAGFCWTKVHPDGIGEIYVIAVEPTRQGTGLGRALATAGLNYLHDVRRATIGMLYVDAANKRALDLYDRLGFWVDHIDRSFLKLL